MPQDKEKRIRQVIEEVIPDTPANPQEKAKEVLKELDRLNAKTKRPKKEKQTSLKLIFLITVITALIVGFVSGGVYVYFSGVTNLQKPNAVPTSTPSLIPEPTPTPSATAGPTVSPSPKPTEKIDLTAYKVSVLNGSGKIGGAGKVSDLLKKEGFTVTNIANAARYDYTDTIVQVTEEVPGSVVDLIKKALSDNYSVKIGDKLGSTSKYEIVITVGSK